MGVAHLLKFPLKRGIFLTNRRKGRVGKMRQLCENKAFKIGRRPWALVFLG